jgi:nitrogen fixation protein FixH
MSQSSNKLMSNALYIALYARPALDEYHWALYLHLDDGRGGYKAHASNLTGPWIVSCTLTKGGLLVLHRVKRCTVLIAYFQKPKQL